MDFCFLSSCIGIGVKRPNFFTSISIVRDVWLNNIKHFNETTQKIIKRRFGIDEIRIVYVNGTHAVRVFIHKIERDAKINQYL